MKNETRRSLDALKAMVEALEADLEKEESGTKIAGQRVRTGLSKIGQQAKAMRKAAVERYRQTA